MQPAPPSIPTQADAPPRAKPLRLGFISLGDPFNQDSISGFPFHAWNALGEVGNDLVEVARPRHAAMGPEPQAQSASNAPSQSASAILRRTASMLRARTESTLRGLFPGVTARNLLALAERRSARVNHALVGLEPELDALVVGPMSSPLYRIKTDLPIIYASDATAALLNRTYSRYSDDPEPVRAAREHLDTSALARASIRLFASDASRRSAIEDHHADPETTFTLPFGVGLEPAPGEEPPITPPTRDHLNLLFIGADPVRKRLDLAIDTCLELRARGWHATLTAIGVPSERASDTPCVTTLGRLSRKHPDQLERFTQAVRDCHMLILPSEAELFGIAPGEAAQFAKPSVVSDVGGLPTAVLGGRTGALIDPHAPPAAWADAVESLASPTVYQQTASAALERARKELNWRAWARTVTAHARALTSAR